MPTGLEVPTKSLQNLFRVGEMRYVEETQHNRSFPSDEYPEVKATEYSPLTWKSGYGREGIFRREKYESVRMGPRNLNENRKRGSASTTRTNNRHPSTKEN